MKQDKMRSKKSFFGIVKYFSFLNLGILMMSVGIYFFKSTNGFATGGVSGISILLARILPFISQGTYMMMINVILLILGVIILGKKCGALTFYCSLMMSLENLAFEQIFHLDGPLTQHTMLELVYAVGLTGIGAAIIFKCNASSGGTDIVALILKKYTHMNVGEALLISDFVIAASTIFIYGIEAGLFSLVGLFAKVFVVDDLLDSMNMCKAFTIITTKAAEIDDFIMNELHHGATVHSANGAYSGEEKQVIITVCRRTEALKLRRKIKEIDPHSFIIITKTSEIMGKGFRDV
ncbi:MAG: YitT family protein [Clostridia bacterium]|nr:YitT family protein [Clostridia bacterium]